MSYGVSFMRILKKIDCVITALHCIWITRSTPWLLILWLLASIGHQCWLCRIMTMQDKLVLCLLRGMILTMFAISVLRNDWKCKYVFLCFRSKFKCCLYLWLQRQQIEEEIQRHQQALLEEQRRQRKRGDEDEVSLCSAMHSLVLNRYLLLM